MCLLAVVFDFSHSALPIRKFLLYFLSVQSLYIQQCLAMYKWLSSQHIYTYTTLLLAKSLVIVRIFLHDYSLPLV